MSAAVEAAKRRAGDGVVAVCADDVGGQAPWLGLVNEAAIDVVPTVFGTGKRYFGGTAGHQLLENPDVVIEGDRVLHLRFRVRHQRPHGYCAKPYRKRRVCHTPR